LLEDDHRRLSQVLTKKQKLIGAVALAVVVTIVFGLAKITTPPKTIVWLSLAAFVGSLLGYIWVRKRYNLTFGRLKLRALVTTGVTAAILAIGNLLAGR
jgi:hypothetical protein